MRRTFDDIVTISKARLVHGERDLLGRSETMASGCTSSTKPASDWMLMPGFQPSRISTIPSPVTAASSDARARLYQHRSKLPSASAAAMAHRTSVQPARVEMRH